MSQNNTIDTDTSTELQPDHDENAKPDIAESTETTAESDSLLESSIVTDDQNQSTTETEPILETHNLDVYYR